MSNFHYDYTTLFDCSERSYAYWTDNALKRLKRVARYILYEYHTNRLRTAGYHAEMCKIMATKDAVKYFGIDLKNGGYEGFKITVEFIIQVISNNFTQGYSSSVEAGEKEVLNVFCPSVEGVL